jgi:MYXO-CTERM domain-containing protein
LGSAQHGKWLTASTDGGQHTTGDIKIMHRILSTAVLASALSLASFSPASATTPPSDPNDVAAVDNPIDENDDEGFDDWGLLGLIGLVGLAGLAGRRRRNDATSTYDQRGSSDISPR